MGSRNRLRPLVMTALAMIWHVAAALGFGEGGEQNAPLGRAVVGGSLTIATSPHYFSFSRFQSFATQFKAEETNPSHGLADAIPAT